MLAQFTRDTFREELSKLGNSSNWIGAMLRLFLKAYPAPATWITRTPLSRALDHFGQDGLADYLRSKGFRVTKLINDVTDKEIIALLESQGYIVEGLLDGSYYGTTSNGLSQIPKKDLKPVNSY